jgi:hypothetical protein
LRSCLCHIEESVDGPDEVDATLTQATAPHRKTWWPVDLGMPSTSGSADDLRYAYFPFKRRLAIERHGIVSLYDTGEHHFRGVLQLRGHDGELSFATQSRRVNLAELTVVDI